ncbi:uncharacterized protein LOC127869408 [Dreissena polymorpha]|uniref:uncharacterized protein LOC127869408 n=1 Tax=Dreissena polymorpha TaxID=45954 RepID=UPI002264BC9B|nr:uncharacterized protein LOC127869408 [Dreissena polymorpha]XP_052267910.1 uncharacterized protein LOC127869408 [Dreissena polymorpha]XP_052267911.1 uncharacterized protein LOC127869408 [Dreissena polymorpha]XP_052267912.1 uncharacterized protein LOC127869408 [Dreissena polymorpha]
MSSHKRASIYPSKGQCQNLTLLLGEARSGSDRHHLSHNTMPFKCLLQSAGSVAPIMSLLTIFQLASGLAGVLPGLVERAVPLASGCVLLQLKSAQALATLLSRVTFYLGKVAVRALSPSNMRTVHGYIAGIPESQDLMELQTSLSFKPAISISDILITNLERVEPYRPAPPGFPRLVKISFLASIPVPNKILVKDTSITLDIRPCPVTPARCFNCQGFGHIASRGKCSNTTSCCRCAGATCQRRCTNKFRLCANCGCQHSASYQGCPSYKKAIHIATYANFYGVTWSEAESRLLAPDTVSHSVGALNTIITTGSASSPKHAPGSISPQAGRTCTKVEGLVGKSTPPQPINRESPPKVTFVEPVTKHTPDLCTTPPVSPIQGDPPTQRRPPVATRGSSPSTTLIDSASDTTCSGPTLSDDSMFDITGRDSLVSVHSSILENLSISGVCEIEEEPRVSVPPNRPRMVDSQTSPMSSPTDNTSRRNSFTGDSFIKIKDPPATGPTYRKIYLSELAGSGC